VTVSELGSPNPLEAEPLSQVLIGTWKLLSWDEYASDGTVTHPLGVDAVGYLAYTAEGYVFVQMMRSGRGHFSAGDALGVTVREISQTLGFAAYGGTYEIRDDVVVHHVELSPFPNWPDGELIRRVECDGDRLILTTPSRVVDGGSQFSRLTWERVSVH
jgi:hypothetical protein